MEKKKIWGSSPLTLVPCRRRTDTTKKPWEMLGKKQTKNKQKYVYECEGKVWCIHVTEWYVIIKENEEGQRYTDMERFPRHIVNWEKTDLQ